MIALLAPLLADAVGSAVWVATLSLTGWFSVYAINHLRRSL